MANDRTRNENVEDTGANPGRQRDMDETVGRAGEEARGVADDEDEFDDSDDMDMDEEEESDE